MGDEPIEMPKSAAELVQHEPVTVAVFVVTAHGDKPVLAGRTSTTHLRPRGTILQVRPQLKRPWPVRRNDPVRLRCTRRPDQPPLEPKGQVSWVRDRAFMPSGLAVSLIGITFDWNEDELALEVAAFLGG